MSPTDSSANLPPTNIDRLVRTLARHRVEYVLIGGVAGLMHGALRPTQDVDILSRGGLENLTRLANALHELGARLGGSVVDADDLRGANTRWETSAGRVDVLLSAKWPTGRRVVYGDLAVNAEEMRVGTLSIPVVSLSDLISLKEGAGREKDVAALVELRELVQRQRPPAASGDHLGPDAEQDPIDHDPTKSVAQSILDQWSADPQRATEPGVDYNGPEL